MGLSSNFEPNKDGDYPMTETMTHMFICPKLVGRQLDLTALHILIDRKISGQGQMILISGEAGIGKSRLVAEAKFHAAQRDFQLLGGQCFQTDSVFPYAPLLDLFRSYFAHYVSTSLKENMHPFVSTLSRLLPELALLIPDLTIPPSTPPIEPEEEKRRLFAAMTHFLTEQAAQHPVLLVVEDVHWCDDLTLDFLLHLTRRCRNIPLLLLVTYRSDEPQPRLMRWLTHLDRERLAHDDVAAMLYAILVSKEGLGDDLVDMLYTRSEGNPFFVEELIKSLMTTRELVPVDGIWKRTGRLAAVPRSVQEAVQDRLMEWKGMLALGFLWTGHDYERAGVWFRQALALAAELDDPTLRARSLNRLGNWLVNIGQILEGFEAYQEALYLFEAQTDRQGMAEVFEMLGAISFFRGDPARGVKNFFGRAIELFRNLGDRQRLSSTLAVRAFDTAPETIETTYSSLRTRDECVQDTEEALRLAHQTNSPSGMAFVEMATTWVLSSFGAFGPALAHAQEALRIATNIEHQEWIAATQSALGHLYLLLLEPDRAITCLEAGVADAQRLSSMIWTGYLTPYLALAYILKREFLRAKATLDTILPRDQEPNNFFERQAARMWSELALAQGQTARALSIAGGLLVSAPGDMQQPIPHLLSLKGEALLTLKRPEEAAEALEEAKLGAEQRQAPSILWRIHRPWCVPTNYSSEKFRLNMN